MKIMRLDYIMRISLMNFHNIYKMKYKFKIIRKTDDDSDSDSDLDIFN